MNNKLDTKLIYIQSDYGNSQVDVKGAEFLASLPDPIVTDNEHSGIKVALHSFSFTNAMYNVETEDRFIWLCKSFAYPTGLYVEVYIPPGFYSVTELVNTYSSFYVYNHGTFLGSKASLAQIKSQGSKTVSTFNLYNIITPAITATSVVVPIVPTNLTFSTVTGSITFSYTSQTVEEDTLGNFDNDYYYYMTTNASLYYTGENNNNIYKRLGAIPNNESFTKYVNYTVTVAITTTTDSWSYVSTSSEFPYVVNLQRTNLLYIHLDLLTGTNIASIDKFHDSDLLAVIPFSESFGETAVFIPQVLMWHLVSYRNITNLRVTITDADGTKINFNDVNWFLSLAYQLDEPFDYSNPSDITNSNKRFNDIYSAADARYVDPLENPFKYPKI